MLRRLGRMLAVMAVVLCGLYLCASLAFKDWCRVTILAEAISPGSAWKAVEDETFCQSLFLTHIVTGVRLISTRDPARSADILGTSAATDDERPVIAWITPQTLSVIVNSSLDLKVLACDFEGVRVEIRFPPDEAERRAAWHRQAGEPDPGVDVASVSPCPQ